MFILPFNPTQTNVQGMFPLPPVPQAQYFQPIPCMMVQVDRRLAMAFLDPIMFQLSMRVCAFHAGDPVVNARSLVSRFVMQRPQRILQLLQSLEASIQTKTANMSLNAHNPHRDPLRDHHDIASLQARIDLLHYVLQFLDLFESTEPVLPCPDQSSTPAPKEEEPHFLLDSQLVDMLNFQQPFNRNTVVDEECMACLSADVSRMIFD